MKISKCILKLEIPLRLLSPTPPPKKKKKKEKETLKEIITIYTGGITSLGS